MNVQQQLLLLLMIGTCSVRAMEKDNHLTQIEARMQRLSLADLCVNTINEKSVQTSEGVTTTTAYGEIIIPFLRDGIWDLKKYFIAGYPDENNKLDPQKGLHPAFTALKGKELCELITADKPEDAKDNPRYLSVENKVLLIAKLPPVTVDTYLQKFALDSTWPDIIRAQIIHSMSEKSVQKFQKKLKDLCREQDIPGCIQYAIMKRIDELQTFNNIFTLATKTTISQALARTMAHQDEKNQQRDWIIHSSNALSDINKQLLRHAYLRKLQNDIQSKTIIIDDLHHASDKEIKWLNEHGTDFEHRPNTYYQGQPVMQVQLINPQYGWTTQIISLALSRTSITILTPTLSGLMTLLIPHDTYTRVTWNENGTRLILEARHGHHDYKYYSVGVHCNIITGTLDFVKTLVYSEAFQTACLNSDDEDQQDIHLKPYQTLYKALFLKHRSAEQLHALIDELSNDVPEKNKKETAEYCNAIIESSYGQSAEALLEEVIKNPSQFEHPDLIKRVCERILAWDELIGTNQD